MTMQDEHAIQTSDFTLQPSKPRLSATVQSLAPSGIRKFFDLIATMEDVISLGVGEPDFVTPPNILAAGVRSIEAGQTHYTSNHGMPALREAVGAMLRHRYGVSYDLHEMMITVGVSEGLDLAMRAILNPGDEVIIPDPGYVSYHPTVVMAGGTAVPVRTTFENEFQQTAEDIAAAITPRTTAILLASPNNPTGSVTSRAEMEQIARLAAEHDLIVIADQIYDRLVYDGAEHVCFASLPGMWERTIVLGGFSKDYAMCGWRIGYAAAPRAFLDAMVKIHQFTMLCTPTAGQYAAIEALEHGEDAVQEMLAEYARRRHVMIDGLRAMGLPCATPRGAFYAFPNIASTGLSAEEFAERLLFEEKVAVVPGTAFGEAGTGFLRLAYCMSLPRIEEALHRMGRFVRQV